MEENILEMYLFLKEAEGYNLCIENNFKDGSYERYYIKNFKLYNIEKHYNKFIIKFYNNNKNNPSFNVNLSKNELLNIKINDNLLQLEKEYVTIILEIL